MAYTDIIGSVIIYNAAGQPISNVNGLFIQGDVASDAVDSGNPQKIGGKAAVTPTVVADADRVDAWFSRTGALIIGAETPGSVMGDAISLSSYLAPRSQTSVGDSQSALAVLGYAFNGTTLEKTRSSVETTLLASGARTTTQTSADIITYGCKAIDVIIDITAGTTPALTVTIDGKDPASGKYYNLLTSASLASSATTVLRVGPGLTVAANLAANYYLPRTIRIVVTAGNANSITYSVGYTLMHG